MFAEGRTAEGRAAGNPGCCGKRRRWKGHTRVVCRLGWPCSLEWLPRSIFPGFSMAATVASQNVMKTCSYPAASGWECPDLLFCLPIYTESRQGQCRKRAALHAPHGTVVRNMGIGKVKGSGWMPLPLQPGRASCTWPALGQSEFHDIPGVWRHSLHWHQVEARVVE